MNVIYTVSTKNCNPVCCHSGKQRRILTKFYANSTETLNCKQVTKFQQNRSTSATATASLVKSLKRISVHYRQQAWLIVKCASANGKTSAHLKSVLKMSTVCSNASSKMWTPLPDRFIDDHMVEMFPLFHQARLQLVNVTNLAAVHTLLQLPPNPVVDWIKVRTSWPQSWRDEVRCFMS